MKKYQITTDPAGIVICRVTDVMEAADTRLLAADLLAISREHRARFGRVRVLFDNSRGHAFSAEASRLLAEQLHANRQASDRTAVIVANSLNKLQAKQAGSTTSELFISESAAMTWLQAWDDTRLAS